MSTRGELFDALYRDDPDPWEFETSAYEREKYEATLAALPAPRYRRGLEVGCSIGVLTARLAAVCDALVAVDASEVALAAARTRPGNEGATFLRADVPTEWPDGPFDLVVLSELLYFLEPAEIPALACRVAGSAERDAAVVLVDYLGPCDRPLDGDAAADAFLTAAASRGFRRTGQVRTQSYRIDVLAAGAA